MRLHKPMAGAGLGMLLAATLVFPAAAQTRQAAPAALRIVPRIAPLKTSERSKPRERSQYLMVYFKDATHSVHFAVSEDGYSFTDVNDGKPVLSGRDIAEQKGIRDPYITRGPDGAFYLAMTDLHINAQREGLRPTEWERPFADYGWGNNRALVFMKSFDLIHWTHAIVRIDALFPAAKEAGTAWAPEVIYDQAAKKMMVYYTTRRKNETLHMVYSYADKDFTTLTSPPRDLFQYPKPSVISIDGDITRVGNKYHLFYGVNEAPAHILQAVSSRINGGYIFSPTKINPETVDTEGPNVWRRHGTKTYVLMYDAFGLKPEGNMGFSETTDFVHFRDIGHFNEPNSPMKATNFSAPKHGAVMAISAKEAQKLKRHFSPQEVGDR